MRRKFRRHFLLDLLPRRVCVACVQVREGSLRAIEQSSAALERDDRVIERRLVRTVRDRIVVKIGGGHGGDLRKTEQCATEDAKSMWHSGGLELNVFYASHHLDLAVDFRGVCMRRFRI